MKEKIKFCLIFFDNLALILCLIFSGFLVKLQLDYYLENDDIASISFSKIEEGGKDQYPTYTICLFSDEGSIFRQDSSSWSRPDITPFNYHEYLRGWESRTNNNEEEFRNLSYDEVSHSLFDGILFFLYGVKSNGSETVIYSNEAKDYFEVSHQDFKRLCFSKIVKPEYFFVEEMLVISQSKLEEFGVGMEIYVHQQGKIHRKIPGKTTILIPPIFNSNGEEFHHEFSISGIELLQRRETGRIPCNKSIDNEDIFVRESIMETVGCIPSYWKKFGSNLTVSLPACNREQNNIIYKILQNRGRNKNNSYLHPCNQMEFNVRHDNSKHVPILNKNENILYGALSFYYTSEWYKEIIDKQKFTFETLFAQIGGFVGKLL